MTHFRPIRFALLGYSILFLLFAAGQVSAQPPSGLLVAYSLDDGAGTTVADDSGNGSHATLSGATWTSTGRFGSALSFDGVNDRIIGPRVTLGSQFTLMAWVYSGSWQPYETVLSVGPDRDLFLGSGTATFFANGQEIRFGAPMQVNAWHHLAITSDGSAVRAYVDGALAGTAAMALSGMTGNLHVGAWPWGSAMTDFWSGLIDEVRIYGVTLSLSEIQAALAAPVNGPPSADLVPPMRSNGQPSGQLASTVTTAALSLSTDEAATCRYSTVAGTPYWSMVTTFAATGGTSHVTDISGLRPGETYSYVIRCQDAAGNVNTTDFGVAFGVESQPASADLLVVYPMDEGSGDLVRDGSGRGLDGVRSGATWSSAGRFAGALTFDGVNDVVNGPTMTLGGSFTFMGWVYKPSSAGYETVLTIGSDRSLYMQNGIVGFYTGAREVTFGQVLPTNAWQHVAITYDGNSLRAYLNGTAIGTSTPVSLGSLSGVLQVGAWSGPSDFLRGTLDEVRVYSRALSATEVGAEMSLSTVLPPIPDTTPPVVTLTSPPSGTVVSGIITLSATATDDRGVVGVQFMLDGAALGPEDTVSPYTFTWDTATASVGSHTLQSVARDAAGNQSTASAIVSVSGAVPPPALGFALRFTGAGVANVNRINIRLDAPERPVDVGAGDFTLEWWMKVEPGAIRSQSCQTGRDGWIWGDIILDRDVYWDGDFGDFGVSLFRDGVAFGVSRGTTGGGVCGGGNLATGAWTHVAVTRRSSDGQLQIFVNGRLRATGPGPTGNVSYRNGRATQYPQSDPFLVIGAEKHNVVPPLFTGLLDEVRVSTSVRYGSDFTRPSQPFVSDSSTAALYHFDEGQGDVIGDSSEAPGGPSTGTRRTGGTPAGPEWVSDTPFN